MVRLTAEDDRALVVLVLDGTIVGRQACFRRDRLRWASFEAYRREEAERFRILISTGPLPFRLKVK